MDVKLYSRMDTLRRKSIWNSSRVSYQRLTLIRYVNLIGLFMDLSRYLVVEIFVLIKFLRLLTLPKMKMNCVSTRRSVGARYHSWYCMWMTFSS